MKLERDRSKEELVKNECGSDVLSVEVYKVEDSEIYIGVLVTSEETIVLLLDRDLKEIDEIVI